MGLNTEKFTGRVADYALYRERYDPSIVLPFLQERCGLRPEWVAADIGAGTGMLADVFLANGNHVIAVEPNAEMRYECARLHPDEARLTIVDGAAETTSLAAFSVDILAVGRALHWFDMDRAILEFRRVLRPDGWLLVAACGRARDGREENLAYEKFLHHFAPRGEGPCGGYTVYERVGDLFAPGTFQHIGVSSEMNLTWEMLHGLSLSLSHAPRPHDQAYESFEDGLREFFIHHQVDGRVTFTTRYWLNAGRLPKT